MTEKDLKPCPFCGSENTSIEEEPFGFQVLCWKCEARNGYEENKDKAIEAWNRRIADV